MNSITSEDISLEDIMNVVRSIDGTHVRFVFNEVQSNRSYIFGHVLKRKESLSRSFKFTPTLLKPFLKKACCGAMSWCLEKRNM